MPRRLQSWRSMASKSALHAQLQQLGQLPGHTERLVPSKALCSTSSFGAAGSSRFSGFHVLAQERLHLGPGVPVVRALGADHSVPLRVKEVGLVQELLPGSSKASTCCLTRCASSSGRCAGCLVLAPPSSPAASPCARSRVPPAAPPATDDHRRVDQVLVVLVAEEALAQLGQPVLSALQGAHELLLQDVVVGPLADEGLVAVEVLAGGPQAQVRVVVLARPGIYV